MKIGIDIRAINSPKLTGVGAYVLNAVKNIVEKDKDNQYFLLSSGFNKDTKSWINFKNINATHKHIYIPNKVLNLSLLSNIGPHFLKYFHQDMDLLWLPNINFYKSNKKIPFILTIHDLSFLHSKEFYSIKRKLWHRFVKVERLVEKADKIIAVSHNTKRDIVRFFGVDESKIKVINPGIDAHKMNDDLAHRLIQDYKISDKFFVYVGTIEPRKNIASIIKAFDIYHKEHPDTELIIVGGKGWIYEKLFKSIQKRKYVKYLNYVSGPKKDALYYLSQGLIWPSFYEGFGFPPLEATFNGTPVIVSYKTSLPEIMKNQAIYIDPYNVADIYNALESLNDKKLIDDLHEKSKLFDIPTWETQASEIIDLFNSYKTKK